MFAPTKIWRRWHRRVNRNQRRYAVCSALAASAVPALVMARGHRIDRVAEVPLVVAQQDVSTLSKTKQAVALLKKLGAYGDVERVIQSHHVRKGKGKSRNRRYTQRRGPLVVFHKESTLTRAFRNIPGVDLANFARLNLLQLAPGGHLGRFVIFTQAAFAQLDKIFGSATQASAQKNNYHPPRSIISNPDIGRIINSEEVQAVVRDVQRPSTFIVRKKNALRNLGVLVKLNPFALAQRRRAISVQRRRAAIHKEELAKRHKGEKTKGSEQAKKNRQELSKLRAQRTTFYAQFKNQ